MAAKELKLRIEFEMKKLQHRLDALIDSGAVPASCGESACQATSGVRCRWRIRSRFRHRTKSWQPTSTNDTDARCAASDNVQDVYKAAPSQLITMILSSLATAARSARELNLRSSAPAPMRSARLAWAFGRVPTISLHPRVERRRRATPHLLV